MSYDDAQKGNGNRRRFSEGRGNYSPSSNYHFNANGGNYQGHHQQHPRRRSDRYRRESLNSSDRLVKQNDIIIKLLKEIRDRLPPVDSGKPQGASRNTSDNATNESSAPAAKQAESREKSDGETSGNS